MKITYDDFVKLPEGSKVWYASFRPDCINRAGNPLNDTPTECIVSNKRIFSFFVTFDSNGKYYLVSKNDTDEGKIFTDNKQECVSWFKDKCRTQITDYSDKRRKVVNDWNEKIRYLIHLENSGT